MADASEARSFVGTAGFIPPEGPGGPQADLYSLGKVLYEISTGQDRQDFPRLPPDLLCENGNAECGTRSAESLSDAAQPIPRSALLAPRSFPLIELNEVLLKACHKDVRQRYASADAMLADLELLQRGQSAQRKRVMERRWVVFKKLILTGCVTAAIGFLSSSGRKDFFVQMVLDTPFSAKRVLLQPCLVHRCRAQGLLRQR